MAAGTHALEAGACRQCAEADNVPKRAAVARSAEAREAAVGQMAELLLREAVAQVVDEQAAAAAADVAESVEAMVTEVVSRAGASDEAEEVGGGASEAEEEPEAAARAHDAGAAAMGEQPQATRGPAGEKETPDEM